MPADKPNLFLGLSRRKELEDEEALALDPRKSVKTRGRPLTW
jgi:hypothetical protein